MRNLSITTAWNETLAFVRQNASALFTIAFGLVALPTVALQVLAPAPAAPGTPLQPGPWLLLLPVVFVLSIAGSLALAALATGREKVVGSAISRGFARFLPTLGAVLLMTLAAMLILLPLLLALGLSAGEGGAPPQVGGTGLLLILVVLVAAIFFWVRLMLMTPVAASEDVGPIAIIRRSWALTAGRFWPLLGFALLFMISAIVLMLVPMFLFGIVVALIAGPPAPGSFPEFLVILFGGVINAVFIVYFTTMISRIYAQLGTSEASPAPAVY